MRRLFAEAFLDPRVSSGPEPELRYDEERCLNVMADGRPFIVAACAGRTPTPAEGRIEQNNRDHPGVGGAEGLFGGLDTITKVLGERDDFASSGVTVATETRQAPGERDDFARGEIACSTETDAQGEDDDFARGERCVGECPAGRFGWGGLWAGRRCPCDQRPTTSSRTSKIPTPVPRASRDRSRAAHRHRAWRSSRRLAGPRA